MTLPKDSEQVSIQLLHGHLRGLHTEGPVEGCTACTPPAVSAREPRPRQQNKPAPTGRKCRCGCGADVARRYLPGHDAKHKSRLVKAARDGSDEALAELRRYGWEHFV